MPAGCSGPGAAPAAPGWPPAAPACLAASSYMMRPMVCDAVARLSRLRSIACLSSVLTASLSWFDRALDVAALGRRHLVAVLLERSYRSGNQPRRRDWQVHNLARVLVLRGCISHRASSARSRPCSAPKSRDADRLAFSSARSLADTFRMPLASMSSSPRCGSPRGTEAVGKLNRPPRTVAAAISRSPCSRGWSLGPGCRPGRRSPSSVGWGVVRRSDCHHPPTSPPQLSGVTSRKHDVLLLAAQHRPVAAPPPPPRRVDALLLLPKTSLTTRCTEGSRRAPTSPILPPRSRELLLQGLDTGPATLVRISVNCSNFKRVTVCTVLARTGRR